MLEKAGLLNKTKIAEGGRKLKKNWSISRVVLVGNSLAFYKETKTQTAASWKPGNRPESSVDLRGSLIEWTKEMSSKKNVFRLRTVTGNEFLFQAENEDYISDWYKTIKNVIETLWHSCVCVPVCACSRVRECELDLLLVFAVRRMNSDSSEKKRVKSRLRKFITKRPPLQSLQEKGLIKDQVFGCRLETLCDREKENVPKFVQLCIDAVEKRGLEADGIYRVSGNLATIQKLRFLVDHEEKLNMDDAQWEDVHVITGALKMFFRELPEPLVPYNSFEHFVSAITDAAEKVESIKQLVWSLPKPNQDTMRVMFRHLKKVVEHSEANRMTAQSIAIVFGPTLMRSEKDFSNMAVHMVYQNQIVELILVECDGIFNPENKLLR
uniref:Rho GTPase activating protein 27 n=1 Tax=Callorhinchus milii TaxID=7868 RepID=A0A4W3KGJ0_CALMI